MQLEFSWTPTFAPGLKPTGAGLVTAFYIFIKLHSIPVKTMSEKKHPILFGILIYFLVACGLLVLWGGLNFFLKEDGTNKKIS
jgi:hypothetical protein